MVRLGRFFGTREPDLKALEDFAARGDRDDTPFFAGRDEEIAAIDGLCARALVRAKAGTAIREATQLFQGAPGAGKTALLSELSRRWSDRETGRCNAAPVAVHVYFHELADEAVVAAKIAEALDPEAERAYRRTETRDIAGQAGIPGVGSGQASRRTGMAPPVPSFDDLCRRFPPSSWTRPVCLMVDEIQNVAPAAKEVLNTLHEGKPGLPVVPVLAGLGNLYDIVSAPEVGLSCLEIDAVHSLGALAPDEAHQAVETMLAACRVDRTGADDGWPALLAERSDGWPQHLHNGMRALAAELVRVDGKLVDVGAEAVLGRERDYRERAYLARISPEMEASRQLIAALFAALPQDGVPRDVIETEVDRLGQPHDAGEAGRRALHLPRGMDSVEFVGHLIRRGALQRGPHRRYGCPIPSFRRFLIDFGTGEYGAIASGNGNGGAPGP